jgi:hypothetical protein
MSDYDAWNARMEAAPPAEEFLEIFRRLQANRGDVVDSTGPNGEPLRMYFYRDLEVTVRFFPETADGLANLLTITYPRFEEIVLAIYDGPTGKPILNEYRPGPWLNHLKSVSEWPRATWHDLLSFNFDDPGQREIVADLLKAGRILAEFGGERVSHFDNPSMQPEVELFEMRLARCRVQYYKLLSGEPMLFHVMTEFDEQLFSMMRHTERGWECSGMIAGPWIDEVLATYEQFERQMCS